MCSQLSILPAVRERDASVLNRVKSRGLHFSTQPTFKRANTTSKRRENLDCVHKNLGKKNPNPFTVVTLCRVELSQT